MKLAEWKVLSEWKEERALEEARTKACLTQRHADMLTSLHKRCEERARALREERFWWACLADAQQEQEQEFPY